MAATVLLPFSFMATGLRALIEPDSAAFLGVFIAATAATILGKVTGAAIPVRAAGERWSFALALGSLMQSKGLMEVVVLAVLLDAGLIGQTVYSALVAMAVACTVAAAPLARPALARGGTTATALEGSADAVHPARGYAGPAGAQTARGSRPGAGAATTKRWPAPGSKTPNVYLGVLHYGQRLTLS